MPKYESVTRFNGKYLCILDQGLPMVPIEMARLISTITDDDISLLARGQPREIKGYCELKRMFVGAGTCVARKYAKYGLKRDALCEACKSDSIVEQVNYIFQHKYGDKYYAEWRRKRANEKRK